MKRMIKGSKEKKMAATFLLQPSLVEAVKKDAKRQNKSINEIVRECIAKEMIASGLL